MPTLLVVDDEPSILHFFRRAFADPKLTLLTAGTAAEGLEAFRRSRADVAVLDISLPDADGLELLKRIHAVEPKTPVIFITGHGTADTAIEAMKLGAYEYLLKPLELDHLQDLVARAMEISRLMRVPAAPAEPGRDDQPGDLLIGRCPAMQEVYKAVGRVAPQDVIALILGESGTGKELVARAIYHHSRRAAGPFLAINCAAIPETLLESELFGHEKGAFTGADRRRIGKFEQCNGGTLFLDEIGDMSPLTQGKILRVLQDQTFERLGGNETVRTNVRLIAATHRDLERMVAEGRFRGDLFYRLSVFTVRLPPLRERAGDIPALAEYFVRRAGRELGKAVTSISPEAMELLTRYRWPGNVRELQSVVKQALLAATGPVLVAEFLPAALRGAGADTPACEPPPSGAGAFAEVTRFVEDRLAAGTTDLYSEWRGLVEPHLFGLVLARTGGNLSAAAKILGINRATLRTRLEALGMKTAEKGEGDGE